MKNFFRGDLKLNQKRWHRALKVIWFIGLFIVLIICGFIFYIRYDSEAYRPTRVYVGKISDRVDDSVKDIRDIIKDGEYLSFRQFSYSDRFDVVNDLIEFPRGMGWCSKTWDNNKLIELNRENGFIKYFNDSIGSAVMDYNKIVGSINQPCIFNVEYNKDISLHYNSGTLYIYYINNPNKYTITIMWLIQSLGISLLFIGAYIIITILLYYKGILYIIYGNKK